MKADTGYEKEFELQNRHVQSSLFSSLLPVFGWHFVGDRCCIARSTERNPCTRRQRLI